jgi:GNAT superfamily N-acetyltransferase
MRDKINAQLEQLFYDVEHAPTRVFNKPKMGRHYECEYVKFYVRTSWRFASDTGRCFCLDLASIDVASAYQRQGIFRYILLALTNYAEKIGARVIVENVLNDNLWPYLESLGYTRREYDPPECPTYFAPITTPQ